MKLIYVSSCAKLAHTVIACAIDDIEAKIIQVGTDGIDRYGMYNLSLSYRILGLPARGFSQVETDDGIDRYGMYIQHILVLLIGFQCYLPADLRVSCCAAAVRQRQ